jgi:hypothetical protein
MIVRLAGTASGGARSRFGDQGEANRLVTDDAFGNSRILARSPPGGSPGDLPPADQRCRAIADHPSRLLVLSGLDESSGAKTVRRLRFRAMEILGAAELQPVRRLGPQRSLERSSGRRWRHRSVGRAGECR